MLVHENFEDPDLQYLTTEERARILIQMIELRFEYKNKKVSKEELIQILAENICFRDSYFNNFSNTEITRSRLETAYNNSVCKDAWLKSNVQ